MKELVHHISTIAFDADDTLWVNEPFFRAAEDEYYALLRDYLHQDDLAKALYETEMQNLALFGYGIKGFVLSMIETLAKVTNNQAPLELVIKVMDLGKEMLNKPVELLPGVADLLAQLNGHYRLILATKGDLLDQERKLEKSGLAQHFHHIEVMSDKRVVDYQKLLAHLDCAPDHFLMVGNSIKSDILPVLELGGHAIHVPFHTTWVHEHIEDNLDYPNAYTTQNILDILPYLNK